MAAPVLVKTWQIDADNLIPVGATNVAEARDMFLLFKNKLIGFATLPLTVAGSSNGTTFGFDAVDRWTTAADLVQNAWIVLQDAQVNPTFQICFQLIGAGWVTSGQTPQLQITVSRLAGFGAAAGGSNGNATTRPTASDEDARANMSWPASAASHARRLYFWRSTDGQVTRVLWRNVTAGTWYGLFEWGRPRVPRSLWTNPCYYRFGWNAGGLDAPWLLSASFLVTAYRGSVKVTDINTHIAGPFSTFNANLIPAALNQQNDWESPNDYDTYRIYLNSPSVANAKGGIIGELFDLRAVPPVISNGIRMPDTAPYTWCAFGDAADYAWLLPWNNTTPKFTAAP